MNSLRCWVTDFHADESPSRMWQSAPLSQELPATESGERLNVCMVIANAQRQVLLCERFDGGWQFPQGGVKDGESPEEAAYRELAEETGLRTKDVHLLGSTEGWFRYTVPRELNVRIRAQIQKWYLFSCAHDAAQVDLVTTSEPEFRAWQWVSFWHPLSQIVEFKRDAYRQGLLELAPILSAWQPDD